MVITLLQNIAEMSTGAKLLPPFLIFAVFDASICR